MFRKRSGLGEEVGFDRGWVSERGWVLRGGWFRWKLGLGRRLVSIQVGFGERLFWIAVGFRKEIGFDRSWV